MGVTDLGSAWSEARVEVGVVTLIISFQALFNRDSESRSFKM